MASTDVQPKVKTIWLRYETKPFEHRVILTPAGCKELLELGYNVHVERSDTRCYKDEEYEATGVVMEEPDKWLSLPADPTLLIIGLKELNFTDKPVINNGIFYAHVFLNQEGCEKTLQQFIDGKSIIWDLEFLRDTKGRESQDVMSVYAGLVGAGLAIKQWCWQQLHPGEKPPAFTQTYPTKLKFFETLRNLIDEVIATVPGTHRPRAMVIGAHGRCGTGACETIQACGLDCLEWDHMHTTGKTEFPEILQHEIYVNCIQLREPGPPFITKAQLDAAGSERKLSVIADVSCDITNPNNPLPIYDDHSTWWDPVVSVRKVPDVPLDIIAIDNLPSAIPREASDLHNPITIDFIKNYPDGPGCQRAKYRFERAMREIMGKDVGKDPEWYAPGTAASVAPGAAALPEGKFKLPNF